LNFNLLIQCYINHILSYKSNLNSIYKLQKSIGKSNYILVKRIILICVFHLNYLTIKIINLYFNIIKKIHIIQICLYL